MPTVFANSRSVVHKGDGLTNVCAPPDVCKTPGPPTGPVPVPYVNVAQDAMLAEGTKKVSVEGNPVAIASSNISMSSGNEPGSAGGLISAKIKGKAGWLSASPDVTFEGKGVVRFLDAIQHNGNTYNAAFAQQGGPGGTGWAYGDDAPCRRCSRSTDDHRIHETPNANAEALALIDELDNQILLQLAVNVLRQQLNSRGRLKQLNAYMVGVGICGCTPPHAFVACSGPPTPGFTTAVANRRAAVGARFGGYSDVFAAGAAASRPFQPTGLQQVVLNALPPAQQVWECAAPQILFGAKRAGHSIRAMSEVWYAPQRQVPNWPPGNVDYYMGNARGIPYTDDSPDLPLVPNAWNPWPFAHQQTAPSCDKCKKLLPEMNCPNDARIHC
jgi:hypothetical protein